MPPSAIASLGTLGVPNTSVGARPNVAAISHARGIDTRSHAILRSSASERRT